MKERWRYSKYEDEEKGTVYYKAKQRLTWRFFLRIIRKWFTPCGNCQRAIDALWNVGYAFDEDWYAKFISRAVNKMCKKCLGKTSEINETTEVIIGNNDYTPPIELSRKWLNDDDTIIDVTKEEYFKHMLA